MTLILSGTNGLSDVDGTAATPAIRGTDANTGIFFPAADQLAASVNGVEGLRLTSTGLGIGTSTPGVRLDVNGALRVGLASNPTTIASNSQFYDQSGIGPTISGYNFEVRTGNPTPSARMIVDSVGNVGIGTSSPAWKLDVNGIVTSRSDSLSGMRFQTSANGYNGFVLYETSSNSIIVNNYNAGPITFKTSDTERARINSSGNLLVGTTSFAYGQNAFQVENTGLTYISRSGTSFAYHLAIGNANGLVGSITTSGTVTSYNTSSDYRLKNITGPITTSGAYIDSLNPVEGTWKADGSAFVGLIAHEVQEASRTPVATGTKDGEQMQGMDYSSAEIIANMLAELKSLRARVAQLEAK